MSDSGNITEVTQRAPDPSRDGELTTRVAEQGMPALALTDHGSLYGVIPFAAAKKAGIRPIIGLLHSARKPGWINLKRIDGGKENPRS